MKKRCAMFIICILFITSCSNTPSQLQNSVSETEKVVIQKADNSEDQNTEQTAVSNKNEEEKSLLEQNILRYCEEAYRGYSECSDGSRIATFTVDYKEIKYIRYDTKKLPDGSYNFLKTVKALPNIIYNDDNSASVSISINDSETPSLMITIDYSFENDVFSVGSSKIELLNENDITFNEQYSSLTFEERVLFENSLEIKDKYGKDLEHFLRACIYEGNFKVLNTLYQLFRDSDLEMKYKLELTSIYSNQTNSNVEFSKENPYLFEIYYGESSKQFPQEKTIEVIAESLRLGKSFEELGIEEMPSNLEWIDVYEIEEFQKYFPYETEKSRVWGIYKYDIDHDGLLEILLYWPGGTMGNEFWSVLQLDNNGQITNVNSGDGMSWSQLYKYEGDYFFLWPKFDFNDKERFGWTVYALDKNSEIYEANIWLEKTGSEIIINDKYVEKEDYYFSDWYLDEYIDIYKNYEFEAIGCEIKPDEVIMNAFNNFESMGGLYGEFDINNDGVDDWTYTYMFFPSNRFSYYCDYRWIDGKTKKEVDLSSIINSKTYELRCVVPTKIKGKNYFVFVLHGFGNYIIKSVEIEGNNPIVLESWLVSVKNRMLVDVKNITDETNGGLGI